MQYLPLSFIAGILTILAPCVLPVLPLVLGSSLEDTKNKLRPIIIISSLSISIVIFTLVLKASTVLISVDPVVWTTISGSIILFFGIITVFPEIWEKIEVKLKLNNASGGLLHKAGQRKGLMGNILLGASLGPVFASCSPTYAIIVAVILPTQFLVGLINLLVYSLGLALVLILISLLGQNFIGKFKWAVNPNGKFKKILGILFILLGFAIITGYEKKIEIALLDAGFADVTKIETIFLDNRDEEDTNDSDSFNINEPYQAPDLEGISDWINTEPLNMEGLRGKVVLIDFWTYSCINCVRTLPFLTQWDTKYRDQGLVIIGVHAPEFAFEKKLKNVESAVDDYGIKYPVALDNDFSTWRAYENQYWPAKYFIDREGNIRHTHFGEGSYEESEKVIIELLSEGNSSINIQSIDYDYEVPISSNQTPETYLNYRRGQNLTEKNASEFKPDTAVKYTLQKKLSRNLWSLGGLWEVTDDHSTSQSASSKLSLNFSSKEVYLVMGADTPKKVTIKINGKPVTLENKGSDVNKNSTILVNKYDLYNLVSFKTFSSNNTLELEFDLGVQVHAFTFGS